MFRSNFFNFSPGSSLPTVQNGALCGVVGIDQVLKLNSASKLLTNEHINNLFLSQSLFFCKRIDKLTSARTLSLKIFACALSHVTAAYQRM
jgi:hypothetical protein